MHIVIRCENAKREYELLINRRKAAFLIQKHQKKRIAQRTLDDRKKAVICLQSVIRGWLVRRNIHKMQKRKNLNHDIRNIGNQQKSPVLKNSVEHVLIQSSVLEALQRRVCKAEASLKGKEEENSLLQQNLKRLQARWSEYETKMKYMEDKWQKQMISLQVSLAAAKKSLVADDTPKQPVSDASPVLHYYDSEDALSVKSHTPEDSTLAKLSNHTPGTVEGQEANVGLSGVSHLVKEFEQQRKVFNDDARFVIEVKSGRSESSMNPEEELRKLKFRFRAWKRDYKARLRETKATLHKLGNVEMEKSRKKWWGKKSIRGL